MTATAHLRKMFGLGWLSILSVALLIGGAALLAEQLVENVMSERFRQVERLSVVERLSALRARLEGNVIGNAQLVRGLVAAIATEPQITQKRFEAIASKLFSVKSQLRNIGAAPDLVIKFMYPKQGNEAAIGLDYTKNPAQYAAADLARNTGDVVIAGPVNLVQGGQGLISRMPVFVEGDPGQSKKFWGLVSAVIDVERLYLDSGLLDDTLLIDVAIRGKDSQGASGELFLGDGGVFAAHPVLATVTLPYGSWQMAAIPKGGWPTWSGDSIYAPYVRLAFGVCASLIFMIALSLMWSRKSRAATAQELRQAKNAAEKAQEQLTQAIETIEDAFVIYDACDRLVLCNSKYKDFYKKSAEKIVPGTSFEEIIRYGAERGQYAEALGRVDEWVSQRMQMHLAANTMIEQKLDDGRWLKIAERRMPDGGIVGFRVDITALKEAQETAEKASAAKSQFLSVVNHELRTPLTSIRGSLGLLDATYKSDLPDQASVLVELAMRNVDRLAVLIDDLLDLEKIQSGHMEFKMSDIDVTGLVEKSIEINQGYAERLGVRIVAEGERATGIIVGDESRLLQVLANLISNAAKFSPQGGVVSVTWERCKVEKMGQSLQAMRISVKDDGPGIPDEFRQHIFKPFAQVDGSETRAVGGTGLGLSISRVIAEHHQGLISYDSEVGKGSVFHLVVPLKG